MNENARLWVKTLRGDEYRQTTRQLRRKNNDGEYCHCCLGVACDLYLKETGKGRWIEGTASQQDTFDTDAHTDSGLLVQEVREWLGLDSSSGSFDPPEDFPWSYPEGWSPHSHFSLANMNDAGASFDEIANAIEAEPENLFK